MQAALAARRWTFRAPLGYLSAPRREGKSLVPDPERAALIQRAFELFATGRYSQQQVLDDVTSRGLRARHGGLLAKQMLNSILRNTMYIGLLNAPNYGIKGQRGDFDPLVSRGDVLPRAGHSGGPCCCRWSATCVIVRSSSTGLCAVPGMRPGIDQKLVKERGWQEARVLPLPERGVSRDQRQEGQARRFVRGGTGTSAAERGVHAAGEGRDHPRLAGGTGRRSAVDRRLETACRGDPGEARQAHGSIHFRASDRYRDLRSAAR
jgi:hypothetical protein